MLARPLLLLLTLLLVVTSCADSSPRSPIGRSSAALEPDLDPHVPPVAPICPEPGDVPDPFPPDLPGSFTTPAAGTIAGSFSVTSSGEAVYSMALAVPPGRAGLQPTLSITYDSAAGEGPLGMGFSIGGLSAITRCPRNPAQDGEIVPVRDHAHDALCLDGKRLVPLDVPINDTPAPPYPSREYRTFPDTFSRIVADFGEGDGWDESRGPRSLTAYTKSGLILEYGSAESGHVLAAHGVVRSWLLTRMSDRSGNTVAYSYRNLLHPQEGYTVEHAPERIDYTGHPLSGPSRAVVFEYAPLETADVRVLYARGMELRRSLRLDRIKMLGPNDVLVREYRMTYARAQATGRMLLQMVEECALGPVCKPPTRFTWHTGGSPQFDDLPTSIEAPESDLASLMLLDATGDGLDDLVIPDIDMTGGTEQPLVNWTLAPNLSAEGSPSFFSTAAIAAQQPIPTVPSPMPPDRGTPLDYNHDGRMDVLLHDIHGFHATWRVLLATASGTFTHLDTGIGRPFPYAAPPVGLRSPEAGVHLADADGDGMTDLIHCLWNGADYTWNLHRWTPAGPGFQPAPEPIGALSNYPCHAEVHTVDVDADGRVDLVMPEILVVDNQSTPGTSYDAFTYELTGGSWTRTHTKLDLPQPGGRVLFLDVNGDGLPDAVQSSFQDHVLRAFMNTGAGFSGPIEALDPLELPGVEIDHFARLAAPIDWNADGRQDLLLPMTDVGGLPAWRILQSTGRIGGAGMFTIVDPGLPMEAQALLDEEVTVADPHGPRVTDVDGDGIQDVLLLLSDHVHVFKNTLHEEDVLASVTDGLNAHDPADQRFLPNLQISYSHLVDLATTTAGLPGAPPSEQRTYLPRDHAADEACAYPVRCVVGPRRVVSGYNLNNGADQPRHFEVAYRNGRYHRLGRGWLGFGARIVRDLDTGAGTAEFYDNTTFDGSVEAFPYAGQVARAWRWNPSLPPEPNAGTEVGVELLYTNIAYQTVTRPGGTYFTIPYARREIREQGAFTPGGPLTIEEYVRETEQYPAAVLGDTWNITADWDDHGNVLSEWTTTDGVDLELHVTRQFLNDEDDWLIGRLTSQKECSTAAGITQCRTSTRTYDALGRIKTECAGSDDGDPETQLTLSYTRDGFGNITTTLAEDAFGEWRASCTSYDTQGIFPYAHRNPAGHLSFTRYDPALGVLRSAVDPNGLATRWAHDRFGRTTRELGPDGVETTYTLTRTKDGGPYQDEWNLKVQAVKPGWRDDTVQYDSLGRAVRWWQQGVQVGAQPAPRVMQSITFDAHGEHVARRSAPMPDPAPPPGSVLVEDEYEYDGMGRVVKHESPWGAITTYQYIGRTVFVTAPGNATTRIENDPLGRPEKIIDPEGGETSYTYGPFGGLWTVKDPGGAVTTTERDAYGRVRMQVDPDRGKTEAHYNGFGQQLWSRDGAGREVHHAYDQLGRPVQRTDADGMTRWRWDTAAHGIGALAEVESPDGHIVTYSYDALGRPQGNTLEIDGDSFTTGVTYDASGRVATINYPQAPGSSAFSVQRQYDAYGHLLAVRDSASNLAYWQLTSTDDIGRITGETFGNGATTTRTYHGPKNRLQTLLTLAAGTTVQDLAYAYDDRLNLTHRHDAAQTQFEHFRHDKLDRLTCIQSGLNTQDCLHPIDYTPDGNILSKPGVGAYTYDPDHPHAVAAAGGSTFAYDEVGNQIARPGATITYTAFDLPKAFTLDQAGPVALDYDGNQQRIRKTTPAQETLYVGDLYERVTDSATGAVEHRYLVHGPERAVAVVRPDAAAPDRALYLHVDHLGSVEAITNEAGTVTERRSYDAFGARRDPADWSAPPPPASPTSPARLGFTGHEDDTELGLVNMRGRLYDPQLARFITPDPVVAHPGFGQSWNPYSYVLNGPLSHVDPTGFTEEEPEASPDPGGIMYLPPSDEPGVDMFIIVVPFDDEEDAGGAEEVGAAVAPQDTNTWGHTGGWVPQPEATTQELPQRQLQIAAEVGIGAMEGLGDLAIDVAKSLVLNALTFGGYGTWQLGKAIWEGYKEDGVPGALNAINPIYQFLKGGVDTTLAAMRGDYRAAGAAGVKTLVLGAAAVIGAGRGVGPLELRGAAAQGAVAGGATAARVAELRNAIPAMQRGRITMAVGLAEDASGARQLLVGTSEPRGYLRPGVTLQPGETVVRGLGHAEANVVEHADTHGMRLIEVGATRPICPACVERIDASGALMVTPPKAP